MADNKRHPCYMIGMVAELLGMHPQTLRLYERLGLVQPRRSAGKTRLYSDNDVERLRRIQHLTHELGINLAGVEVILNMVEKMEDMQKSMEEEMIRMKKEMEEEMERMRQHFHADGF